MDDAIAALIALAEGMLRSSIALMSGRFERRRRSIGGTPGGGPFRKRLN